MTQGKNNLDGVYLRPVDVETLGFPDEALPFLDNDVELASFYNLIIECINALRLCGTITVPAAQGTQDPDGTYPRPFTRTEIDFPTNPLPYFGNHIQQARIRNFFVDAVNALRRCYVSASPTEQGTSIDGGVYLPPRTIAAIGFPGSPISFYFPNDTSHATLYNYLIDALNILRNCCTCDRDGSTTLATSGLSATKWRGDDFSAWLLTEYAAFLQDTVYNTNYESGLRATSTQPLAQQGQMTYTTHHLPSDLSGYFWEHFDDVNAAYPYTPPVGQVNRNKISQVDVNGGHRSVKAVKTADDLASLFFGFEIRAQEHNTANYTATTFQSLWLRVRYKYSSNFPLGVAGDISGGSGVYMIDAQVPTGSTTLATIATGTLNNASDKVTVGYKNSGSSNPAPNSFETIIGDTAELLTTGNPQELVMYAGKVWDGAGVLIPGQYRVAVWWGDAFGPLHKLYDATKPQVAAWAAQIIDFMRPKVGTEVPPAGESAICYECLSWELEPGAFGHDPYNVEAAAWNPLGQAPTPNSFFANREIISGASGTRNISQFEIERCETEAGEPHRFNGSVWFEWTAPANGTAVFDTIGSDALVDTYLGIYTGTVISSLTEIVVDDDSGGGLSSRASFAAVSGTVYKVQVSYRSNYKGPVKLNWSLT